MNLSDENWIFLGASRGFGRSFLERSSSHPKPPNIVLFSRRPQAVSLGVEKKVADFSREETWETIRDQIELAAPTRIFYFAGGGPYGLYQAKDWKDHRWAFKVSFEFPALLVHHFLRTPRKLKQMILVGSAIAEENADPQAASYCAAKHALKGLVTSIQNEQKTAFDLRLFSPGYMNTELLPANAWPRQQAHLVKSPAEVAEMLWASIHNADDANKHFVLKSDL